nr:phosphatidylglycerol lysyltransferase domain-containing protein [Dietzia sp. SYD-A1]
MRTTVSTARRYAARAWSTSPVTITLLAVMWVVAAVTGTATFGPGPEWLDRVAAGSVSLGRGHLWTLITSGLFVSGLGGLLASTALLLVVGPVAERLLGGARLLAVALISQVAGVLGGVGRDLLVGVLSHGDGGSTTAHPHSWVDPLPWILGVLLAATGRMPTLWRRRIRAVVLAALVTLLLFAGHPQDAVRLSGALAGLAVGALQARGRHHTPLLGGSVRETRTLVALVVAATVLGPLVVSLSSGAVGPLAPLSQLVREVPYTPAQVAELCDAAPGGIDCWNARQLLRLTGVGPLALTLMPSVLILVLADGLRRGRRAARWWALAAYGTQLAASVALLVTGPIEGGHGRRQLIFGAAPHALTVWVVSPLVVLAAVLLTLTFTGRFFRMRASRRAVRRATLSIAAVVLGGFVAFVGLGAVVTEGVAASGLSDPSIAELAGDYPARLIPPAYLGLFGPTLLPVSDAATALFEWIGVAVWAGVIVILWRLLRARRRDEDPAAHERLRELLHTPGGSSLSWMTTWDGNEYWFTSQHPPGRPSVVAFRVVGRVALTTGGPVGPPDQAGPAALEFAEHCALQGLAPCFYSVDDELAAALRAAGWSSVQVAEETVIPLPDLAFTGKRFQDVRTALNRARKEQVTATWTTFAEAPLTLTQQIVAVSEEWVADKGLPEMGFTLGGIDELRDPEVRLLLAVDGDDVVHGVTSWLPVYREGAAVGLTLDFMRRRTGGFRPTTEFLIASAALTAKEEGLEFLSLSGAPLGHGRREPGDGAPTAKQDATALSAALDRVGETLEPVYGFRSLLAFKAKFHPEYRPLHLCYPDAATLPAIGVAVGRAYLPKVGLGQGARLVATLRRARR